MTKGDRYTLWSPGSVNKTPGKALELSRSGDMPPETLKARLLFGVYQIGGADIHSWR